MRKTTTAALMAVGLLLGGLTAATPAQAITGSTAHFATVESGIPLTIDFRVVKMDGSFHYLSLGESISDVKYVCPKSSDFLIDYWNPLGNHGGLAPGECLWPKYEGTYTLAYWRA